MTDRPLVDHTHGDPDDPCLEVCSARDRAASRLAAELDVPAGLLVDRPHPDRPRYRALASPWYDHEPGACVPEDDEHAGHLGFCHAGWELEVYRVDAGWRTLAAGRAYEPVLTTRYRHAAWDPAALRLAVVARLVELTAPRETQTTAADVELYRVVPPP